MSEIPHLGLIEVPEGLSKSRLDYVSMQLTFHRIVRKNTNLPADRMKIGYNSSVTPKLLGVKLKGGAPSVADCLQIMCFATNLGHAYHTFVSSRAITMASKAKANFRDKFLESCPSSPSRVLANRILTEGNYHQVHLINSLFALERCDRNKDSVKIAKAALTAYLDEKNLPEDDNRKVIFKLFRTVRDVSFLPYDLQVARIPLTFNLDDQEAIAVLFKELLCAYNDDTQPRRLIDAIKKFLSDHVYNVDCRCIRHHRNAQNISESLIKRASQKGFDYYQDIWLNPESCLNKSPAPTRAYDEETILKLTFDPKDRAEAMALLHKLEKMTFVRVGYYDRYRQPEEGATLLISQRKKTGQSRKTAFFILMEVVDLLLKLALDPNHPAFLLTAKYFLHHLFNERPIEIRTPVDPQRSVLCTPDLKSQRVELQSMLNRNLGSVGERHEVEFLKSRLEEDPKDDVTMSIPSSILVYGHDNRTDYEFDGLIIHPYRKTEQIIFLESKDKKYRPIEAVNQLFARLNALEFKISREDLVSVGMDCYYPLTI